MNEYIEIEKILGLSFKNRTLLETAFNHSSLKNDDIGIESNEVLELIGDSVMYFLISTYVYENNKSNMNSGEISIIRSNIISNETFASFANKLQLSKFIKLSKGQKKVGISNSMLSNCFEALIGAIYIDLGLNSVKTFIKENFKDEIYTLFSKGPVKNKKMIEHEKKQKRSI
jgi:ribonuclease-3